MTRNAYKYLSIALGVVVVVLLAYIFTRPKPVNTLLLDQDLANFTTQLQQWNVQYSNKPTVQGQQQFSQDLADFAQKIKTDAGY